MADFDIEKTYWERGFTTIAGADEVGRGAFAGPLVASCVIFGPTTGFAFSSRRALHSQLSRKDTNPGRVRIDDSKKLTALQRERADEWIRENALAWGIGKASVGFINRHGLTSATHFAYRSAFHNMRAKLNSTIDFLLIDAIYIPNIRGIPKARQRPTIKGDAKSYSIAAASIIAKVYRDKIMIGLGKRPKYKKYLWHKNKGYGTLAHRNAIINFGVTPHHRRIYLRKI
jgi:ribonuclease HII